jgi:tetratricopeptide (TPR) repeat protein
LRSSYATNWHPLTWISHMLDCQLFGLKSWGHHFTNILLHSANTVLLFLLLRKMTGALWRSASVAALFGWHPLHVESVAWVAERKDLLCTLFWILTLWAYAGYVGGSNGQNPKSRGRRLYMVAVLFFALALMSKPMAVTLPFVMLLLDFWPFGRLRLENVRTEGRNLVRLLAEKVPFFVLSGVSCGLTLWAQEKAMVSTAGLTISQRLGHALIAYVHYLAATIVPHRLSVYYPYERVMPGGEVFVAGVMLVLITLAVLWFARRLPYLATGWLWFLGTLVPVIGLVQVGEQAWADRYTYLPSVGLFIGVSWGVSDVASRARAIRRILPWFAGATGVALLVATSVQLSYWKDTRTLFEHVERVSRNNPLSTAMLGSLLATEGKYDQAIEYYRMALSYSPRFPEAHFYLGNAFDRQGRLDEAIAEYEKAVRFNPGQEQAQIRLGLALEKQQKPQQAAAHYEAVLKLNPESAVAHNDLAKLLHSEGRLDEAISHYSAALRCDPSLAQAHNNFGVLLLQKGQVEEGVAQLREALRLKPGDPESQLNLAQGLSDQGKWSEAADLLAKAATATTPDPKVHYRFAVALDHLGRTREAMGQYASALLVRQDYPEALDGLSWILATDPNPELRNGSEAIRMAGHACALTGRKDPAKLLTLAAAYAENDQFLEAEATAQAALEICSGDGTKVSGETCRRMRDSFRSHKPWRREVIK